MGNDYLDFLEKDLAYKLDEKTLQNNIKAAEVKAAQMSSGEWSMARRLAKTNLFWLAYSILGYTKLSPNLHGHLCNWIHTTRECRYRLLLLPRGHYKSTIYTIAHSIQAALPDDEGNEPWPYCLGTDIRIGIAHETKEVAAKFLSEITNHFISNPALMALFPECVPNPKSQTINLKQLELPRKSYWKEKTFEAYGVGAAAQGNHHNLLKPDDLVGEEAMNSKLVMSRTNDWIDGLQSFLTSGRELDRIDFTGTRWLHEDSYNHIMETYKDDAGNSLIEIYKRPVEEKHNVSDCTCQSCQNDREVIIASNKPIPPELFIKKPIFPEEYPLERLSILRKNRKRFSAQYLNDPDSDANDFDLTRIRYYYWTNPKKFVAFDDTAEAKLEYNIDELHRLVLLDPALSGNFGLTVTGTDSKRKVFVLDCFKDALTTKKLIEKVCEMVLKWRPHSLVVEKVVFSQLYETIFQEAFRKRGIRCNIIMQPVPTGQRKEEKIKTLSEYIDPGLLYLNEKQEELMEEFRKFGASTDIHMIDSLWMGTKNWKYYRVSVEAAESKVIGAAMIAKRDQITGYTHY